MFEFPFIYLIFFLCFHFKSYLLDLNLCAPEVVLFTEWTLATQTVNRAVKKSYGTKSSYHFYLN